MPCCGVAAASADVVSVSAECPRGHSLYDMQFSSLQWFDARCAESVAMTRKENGDFAVAVSSGPGLEPTAYQMPRVAMEGGISAALSPGSRAASVLEAPRHNVPSGR